MIRCQLFEILSLAKTAEQYFDSGFYEDQHDERKLVVYPNKVTKEFADNDKARKIRETKSTACTKSARVEGQKPLSRVVNDDDGTDDNADDDDDSEKFHHCQRHKNP